MTRTMLTFPDNLREEYMTGDQSKAGYWAYLAASYMSNPTREDCFKVAGIALQLDKPNLWHAVWLYRGSEGRCPCAKCQRERDLARRYA